MFGLDKKRAVTNLMQQMNANVTVIQLACCMKIESDLRTSIEGDGATALAAAVTNRLFGKPISPMHASIDNKLVNSHAEQLMRQGEDRQLCDGIVMSLRVLMTIADHSHNAEAMLRYRDRLEWINSIISLPIEAPTPELMEQHATVLNQRYGPHTSR